MYNLVVCCEDEVKPLSETILKQLYKTILDEDPLIKARVSNFPYQLLI